MDFIYPETAQSLFEKIEDAFENQGLSRPDRVRRLRLVLDDLFKELTKDAKCHLDKLHARMCFFFDTYKAPVELKNELHGLRIFANDFHHNSSATATTTDELTCLRALCEGIAFFSKTSVPSVLQLRYAQHKRRFGKPKTAYSNLPEHEFLAVVMNVSPSSEDSKCRLVTCETDEFGLISLLFWNRKKADGSGSDLTPAVDSLRPYSTIFVTAVEKNLHKQHEFSTTDKSLVVLEPDYLFEVKGISDCCLEDGSMSENALFLKRFDIGKPSLPMMTGILVGSRLDDMFQHGENYPFKDTMRRFLEANDIKMAQLATTSQGIYDRNVVKKIYDNAQTHELALQSLFAERREVNVSLEPTFYSARFGLHGRLDALFEHLTEPNGKDILELKSGKPPTDGCKPEHEAQVLLYKLLLEAVFPQRRGKSEVFYSAVSNMQQPLRMVSEGKTQLLQDLLLLRNRLVATELQMAVGNPTPLAKLAAASPEDFPKYSEQFRQSFAHHYSNASPLELAYFQEFCCFVYKEWKIAKVGSGNPDDDDSLGFSALWRREKAEKLERFDVFSDLVVEQIEQPEFRIHLTFSGDNLAVRQVCRLRENDLVLLYPTPDSEVFEPLKFQILKGTLESLSPGKAVVRLNNKELNPAYFNRSRLWALEKDFSENGYKQQVRSLFEFLKADVGKRNLLLGLELPNFEPVTDLKTDGIGLIGNQREVVLKALSAKDYFLIQGPPGTGKTSKVLAEIVQALWLSDENIFVVAFTNQAVSEVCSALKAKNLAHRRLGKTAREDLGDTGEFHLGNFHTALMQDRIFVSTQATLISRMELFDLKPNPVVIVDEASQLLEPQLVGILARASRFILIGDEKQLPAIVLQSKEESRTSSDLLKSICLDNLRESLFYRLLKCAERNKWTDCFASLTHHHRMHEDVSRFPNSAFYNNTLLLADTSKQQASNPINPINEGDKLGQMMSRSRVLFFPSQPSNKSKVNEREAEWICELVHYIAGNYETWYGEPRGTPFRSYYALSGANRKNQAVFGRRLS